MPCTSGEPVFLSVPSNQVKESYSFNLCCWCVDLKNTSNQYEVWPLVTLLAAAKWT